MTRHCLVPIHPFSQGTRPFSNTLQRCLQLYSKQTKDFNQPCSLTNFYHSIAWDLLLLGPPMRFITAAIIQKWITERTHEILKGIESLSTLKITSYRFSFWSWLKVSTRLPRAFATVTAVSVYFRKTSAFLRGFRMWKDLWNLAVLYKCKQNHAIVETQVYLHKKSQSTQMK